MRVSLFRRVSYTDMKLIAAGAITNVRYSGTLQMTYMRELLSFYLPDK